LHTATNTSSSRRDKGEEEIRENREERREKIEDRR
jgi:hypothetical protein